MKNRPILFSAPMIRAILSGAKTQTRRIFKFRETGKPPSSPDNFNPLHVSQPCPYGVPGDRLWVRETCQAVESEQGHSGVFYPADESWKWGPNESLWDKLHNYGGKMGAVVPSIHMPRWASRITLEITGVKVERVQDISEEDAKAEGVEAVQENETLAGLLKAAGANWKFKPYSTAFCNLWESINGENSWAENPFVWAISFQKVSQ